MLNVKARPMLAGLCYLNRGWLVKSSAPLFAMQLQYNTDTAKNGMALVKKYNGDIAWQTWGTAAAPAGKTYAYTYDALNRINSGLSSDHYDERGIGYDPMGNITKLSRLNNNTLSDSLVYTYTSGTNKLANIIDKTASNTGLVSGTTNYSFDGNGNQLSNANTTNTGQNKTYTYNLLNLPQTVTTTGGGTSTFTYDATGQKLRKVNVNGTTTTTTDYISGIQYNNSTKAIGYIQTEGGQAVPNGTAYDYQYYLTDHLGNTRITFGTKTGAAVSIQQDDYYPYGLEILRTSPIPNPKNEYLYNGKELQEELTQYDYGARLYDPLIGRWGVIDPLAEKSRRWSPYNYAVDNPVRFTDPDGMRADVFMAESGDNVADAFDRLDKAEIEVQIDANGSGTGSNNDKKDDKKKDDEQKKKDDLIRKEKTREADAKYPKKKNKIDEHHVRPKYLGGDRNGETVPLDASYHQEITNEFRKEWPYGQGKPSDEEVDQIMDKVYEKFPLPSVKSNTVPAGGTSQTNSGLIQKISNATGLTGIALAVYLVISEGSRLFPPRNLVPIP